MTLLNKLERKMGWLAIENLPLYLVATHAVVYIWAMVSPDILNSLILSPYHVLDRGEVWRLLTFLFVHPRISGLTHPLFVFFYLYLFYIYGSALESEWGSFPFTLFYLLGAFGTIFATFVCSLLFDQLILSGAFYLHLTLFLAFAAKNPDFTILLFFILPVKIKWFAWLTWAWLLYSLLVSPFVGKILILISIANYFLFFATTHYENMKRALELYQHRRKFKDWGKD